MYYALRGSLVWNKMRACCLFVNDICFSVFCFVRLMWVFALFFKQVLRGRLVWNKKAACCLLHDNLKLSFFSFSALWSGGLLLVFIENENIQCLSFKFSLFLCDMHYVLCIVVWNKRGLVACVDRKKSHLLHSLRGYYEYAGLGRVVWNKRGACCLFVMDARGRISAAWEDIDSMGRWGDIVLCKNNILTDIEYKDILDI